MSVPFRRLRRLTQIGLLSWTATLIPSSCCLSADMTYRFGSEARGVRSVRRRPRVGTATDEIRVAYRSAASGPRSAALCAANP